MADTNTFMAVAMNQPAKTWLVEATQDRELIAPEVLPYELGNAISALVRRKAISPRQAGEVWDAAIAVPVALAPIDIRSAVLLAGRCGIYAYDAYFLQCALETRCPLVTLDRGMARVARELGILLVEKP